MKTGEYRDLSQPDRPHALVLGARPHNIGGAIAFKLQLSHDVYMDDCQIDTPEDFEPMYDAPQVDEAPYRDGSLCVITAGVTHIEPFSKVSSHDLSRVIYGSLTLPLECARRYVQERQKLASESIVLYAGQGSYHSTIIFIGSYAQDHPLTHSTSYCAAKAGLNMAAQSLAWELMPEGFHVHCINPHHVEGTPMTEQVKASMMEQRGMTPEEAEAYSLKDLEPRMGGALNPHDIADMVCMIAENPAMGWMSGQPINMYGGCR
jgi:NAD(P)-dependent dehydrogenase (short-subunit alcohol dehydrogenase family)